MLRHTLEILSGVKEVDQILVVSKDSNALVLAREFRAKTLQENGQTNLNTALEKATAVASVFKVDSILILPADLPILRSKDIEYFVSLAGTEAGVLIAPDRRNDGTNALLVKPTGAIQYHFGTGSFQKHIDEAKSHNLPVQICDLDSLQLDLDLPEDLEYLQKMKSELEYEPF